MPQPSLRLVSLVWMNSREVLREVYVLHHRHN